jgi:hypothetical protein
MNRLLERLRNEKKTQEKEAKLKKAQEAQESSPLIALAKEAEQYGLKLFPVSASDKKPLIKGWQHKATNDIDRIKAWMETFPNMRLGAVVPDELMVLDIDKKNDVDGFASLAQLEDEHTKLPQTLSQETPSGGRHLFFRMPPGQVAGNSVSKLADGLDVRANGGFVVCYRLERSSAGAVIAIQGAPDWLVRKVVRKTFHRKGLPVHPPSFYDQIQTTSYARAALKSEAENVRNAKEGTRNDTLNKAAFACGTLVGSGELNQRDVLEYLTDAAVDSGLEPEETENTINSGLNAGKLKPRDSNAFKMMPTPKPSKDPVVIHLKSVPAKSATWLCQVLGHQQLVFERHGRLVHLEGRKGSRESIPTDAESLQLITGTNISYGTYNPKRNGLLEHIGLPTHVAKMAIKAAYENDATLNHLVHHPSIVNGMLLQNNGYYRHPGVYIDSDLDYDSFNWEHLSEDHAMSALATLKDILQDFPFQNEVDKTVAIAAIMTPLLMTQIDDAVPMILIEAHTPGTGKSLLADVIACISLGRRAERTVQTDGEETRKKLTSHFMAGTPILLIDNVSKQVGGSAMDAALTSNTWSDRLLGANTMLTCKVRTMMMVTGNNMRIKGDLARRVIRCRLDTSVENPEERKGFKYGNLIKHVLENRAKLVHAALTITLAYLQSKPIVNNVPNFGSFEAWSKVVREPLLWLQEPDVKLSQKKVSEDSDSSIEGILVAFNHIRAAFGTEPFTAKELVEKKLGILDTSEAPWWQDVLSPGDITVAKVRNGFLSKHRGRIYNGTRIVKVEKRGNKGVRWQLEDVEVVPKEEKVDV